MSILTLGEFAYRIVGSIKGTRIEQSRTNNRGVAFRAAKALADDGCDVTVWVGGRPDDWRMIFARELFDARPPAL